MVMVVVVVVMVELLLMMLLLLLLLRRLLVLQSGLRDLRRAVGAQRGPEAPCGGVHGCEPAVAVLHRAENVGD